MTNDWTLLRRAAMIVVAASSVACARHPTPAPAPDTTASGADGVQAPDGVADFEWRMEHAPGAARFVTRDVFANADDTPLIQVLRTHVPGFCQPRDARETINAAEPCVVSVYVNGLFAPGAISTLRPEDVAGAEYYEASKVPQQYKRGGPLLPVLVLWLAQ